MLMSLPIHPIRNGIMITPIPALPTMKENALALDLRLLPIESRNGNWLEKARPMATATIIMEATWETYADNTMAITDRKANTTVIYSISRYFVSFPHIILPKVIAIQ